MNKRLFATAAFVAVMVAMTSTAGVKSRTAADRDRPAASVRILSRTPSAPKVPFGFGKNRGQPLPPLSPQQQQLEQRPYQRQQQPKEQQRPYQPQQPYQQQQPYQTQRPYQHHQQQQTTTERPKLETTTQDRSIITAPLKTCPEGQRMNPDRKCGPAFVDPEDENK